MRTTIIALAAVALAAAAGVPALLDRLDQESYRDAGGWRRSCNARRDCTFGIRTISSHAAT